MFVGSSSHRASWAWMFSNKQAENKLQWNIQKEVAQRRWLLLFELQKGSVLNKSIAFHVWLAITCNYIIILTCIIRHKTNWKNSSDFFLRTHNEYSNFLYVLRLAFFARPVWFSQWNAKNCNKLFMFIWSQIRNGFFLRLHKIFSAHKSAHQKKGWRNIWFEEFQYKRRSSFYTRSIVDSLNT